MTDNQIHDLAVAFAHVKLFRHLEEEPEDSGYNSEIRAFLKWYHFALLNIPDEIKDIDLSTLL